MKDETIRNVQIIAQMVEHRPNAGKTLSLVSGITRILSTPPSVLWRWLSLDTKSSGHPAIPTSTRNNTIPHKKHQVCRDQKDYARGLNHTTKSEMLVFHVANQGLSPSTPYVIPESKTRSKQTLNTNRCGPKTNPQKLCNQDQKDSTTRRVLALHTLTQDEFMIPKKIP